MSSLATRAKSLSSEVWTWTWLSFSAFAHLIVILGILLVRMRVLVGLALISAMAWSGTKMFTSGAASESQALLFGLSAIALVLLTRPAASGDSSASSRSIR